MDIKEQLPVEWVAGFVEGEGYFGWNGSGYRMTVSQKETQPLELIQQFFLSHGIESRIYQHKKTLCHTLYVSGRVRCRKIRDLLLPHMHSERKRAQLLAAWINIDRDYTQELLNKIGTHPPPPPRWGSPAYWEYRKTKKTA